MVHLLAPDRHCIEKMQHIPTGAIMLASSVSSRRTVANITVIRPEPPKKLAAPTMATTLATRDGDADAYDCDDCDRKRGP